MSIQIASVTGQTTPGSTAGVAITTAGDYTPSVTIASLSGGAGGQPTARISIDDSPDGATWTPFAEFAVAGIVQPGVTSTMSRRCRPADSINAHVRTTVQAVNGVLSYTASV
jgi:hypothetical protein